MIRLFSMGQASGNRRLFDQGGLRVIPLFNELVSKKRLYQQTKMASQQAKKFQGIVNLVVDKSIKYSFIEKFCTLVLRPVIKNINLLS